MNDDPGGLIKELGAPVIILNELFRPDATIRGCRQRVAGKGKA